MMDSTFDTLMIRVKNVENQSSLKINILAKFVSITTPMTQLGIYAEVIIEQWLQQFVMEKP